MRITPTREQMAYLASIGVSNTTVAQPGQGTLEPTRHGQHVPPNPAGHASAWWIILPLVAVVVLLLLFLTTLARAQSPQLVGNAVVSPSGEVGRHDERGSRPNPDTTKKGTPVPRKAGTPATAHEQPSSRPGQLPSPAQQAVSRQETPVGCGQAYVSRKIDGIRGDLEGLKNSIAISSVKQGQRLEAIETLTTMAGTRAETLFAQAQRAVGESMETEVAELRRGTNQPRHDLFQVLNWLIVVNVLGIGFTLIGGILMKKRIQEIQAIVLSHLIETAATTRGASDPAPKRMETMGAARKAITEDKVDVEPMRPRPIPLPTPTEQMQTIIDTTGQLGDVHPKPVIPPSVWGLAVATHKGNVRSENQDYGLCFQIAGHDVLIVADGCGGVPYGQKAAYLAAVSAAVSLVRTYGIASLWHDPRVEDAASWAIADAAHRLAIEGDKLNVSDVRGGLRTTLIVVVGNEHEIGYGYIGDGGGCVVRASGEVHRFLKPQKASDFAMNVLAASLGPMMEGQPVIGTLKRSPGDLLICGTDGVFDRVADTFPKDVLRGCIQHDGDLQKTADLVLEELASFQDNAGYICDDNLTLGIMGDGRTPKLSAGFWLPAGQAIGAPGEPPRKEAASQLMEGDS